MRIAVLVRRLATRAVLAALVLLAASADAERRATPVRYSPEAVARLRQLYLANQDRTYAEVARLAEQDPLLHQVRGSWDGAAIKRFVRGHFKERPDRRRAFSPEALDRLEAIWQTHRARSYDEIAAICRADPLLAALSRDWNGRYLSSVIARYPTRFPRTDRRQVREVKYTPEVMDAARVLLRRHKGRSYAEIARLFDQDPVLSPVHSPWHRSYVALVAHRLREQAPHRPEPYSEAMWSRIADALLARPDASFTEVAADLSKRPPFLGSGKALTASRISDLVSRRDADGSLRRARAEAKAELEARRWQRMRQALLARPTEGYDAIGRILGVSAADVRHAVSERGAAETLRSERERAAALQVADTLAATPRGTPAPEVWKRLESELPGVRAQMAGLLERHPDLLAAHRARLAELTAPAAPHGSSRPRARARVDLDRIEDPHALATRVGDVLASTAPAARVAPLVRVIAQHVPGFSVTVLWRLAEAEQVRGLHGSRLLRELRRHLARGGGAAAASPPLTAALARELDLPPPTVARVLVGSRLVEDRLRRIAELQAAVGYTRARTAGDAVLSPRDLAQADPELRWIVAQVYRETGERRLPLAAFEEALPRALADVDRASRARPDLVPLYLEVTSAALERLSAMYQDDVVLGAGGVSAFMRDTGVRNTPVLQRRLPSRFPRETSAPLDVISTLYREVVEGRMEPRRFYRRTGTHADLVRLLQILEPARFPRQAIRPKEIARTFAALPPRPSDDETRARMTAVWNDEVLTGRLTTFEFRERFQLSPRRYKALGFGDPPAARQRNLEWATAVARRSRELLDEDALHTRDDLVDRINRDRELVGRFGPLTPARYAWLRRLAPPGSFPDLKDADRIIAALVAELRDFLARTPDATRQQALAYLRGRHPRFTLSRWLQIRAADVELASRLEAEGTTTGRKTLARSLPVREMTALALTLLPPGTPASALAKGVNALLRERGLRGYSARSGARTLGVEDLEERLGDHASAVFAEVLVEYAQAAPSGATGADIVRAVQADYPTFGSIEDHIGRWAADRSRHPALAPYWRNDRLVLRGEGRRPARPRFLGGWDVERAVLSDPARGDALALASQYARIPLRLPLLDRAVADLAGTTPLRNHNVLCVSHLLASSIPLIKALQQAGVSRKRFSIVGTPYGTNPAVHRTLLDLGLDVKVPELSTESYVATVRQEVDRIVRLHRQNQHPIVVLDDGGLVTRILHETPAYRDVLRRVRIVEQTTQGINLAELYDLGSPVIAAALALSKAAEAPFIGAAVAGKVLQALRRQGRDLHRAKVAVIGNGRVGSQVARAMVEAGSEVMIVETASARAGDVEPPMKLADLDTALRTADVVIGSTGERSVDLDAMRRMRDGAILVSASSKQVELDMEALRARATALPLPSSNPLVRLPNVEYTLDGKRLTVLGDGWPINFDGDVEDIPPDLIQLTRTLMFLGALQAAAMPKQSRGGVIPFDRAADELLLRRFREERAGKPDAPIGDPDDWRDVIRRVGRTLEQAAR